MKAVRWIEASAGSGKTTRIVYEINELIKSGVDPASILCLSFTKASTYEISARYTGDLSPRFETIHGFANSIIPKDGKKLLIEDLQVENIIKEAMELTLNKEWLDFLDCISYEWSNIIENIKYYYNWFINENKEEALLEQIREYGNPPEIVEISLSQSTLDLMTKSKLHNLAEQMLSNNYEVHRRSIVTNELQINKRLIPESFASNPDNEEALKEIKEGLKNILNNCMNIENNQNMKIVATFNLFLHQVSRNYSLIKSRYNFIDYHDMITEATSNRDMSKIEGIKHIFLDEAQDTSSIQWNFLISIIEDLFQQEEASLTVVGDPKQIIYEFNGASHNLFEMMKHRLKDICFLNHGFWFEESLNYCYRCPQVMLDFVDKMMVDTKYTTQHIAAFKNKAGYIKTWLPTNDGYKDVQSHDYNEEGKWSVHSENQGFNINLCIGEIQKALQLNSLNDPSRKNRYSDIMILVPKRSVSSFLLVHHIKQAGIPIKESPFYINNDDIIRELAAIGSFVFNQEDDLALVAFLKGPYFKLSNSDLEKLCYNRESKSIWSMMAESQDAHIQKMHQTISKWIELPRDIIRFYSEILFYSEYGARLFSDFYNETIIFWECAIKFAESSSNLYDFVQSFNSPKKHYKVNIDGITISTIHGAKGKEANIVFIFDGAANVSKNTHLQLQYNKMFLLKGNYKIYRNVKNKNSFDQDMESDRIFYVAITRAKERLYIIPPISYEGIAPKSIYSRIINNISIFSRNENNEYEIFSLEGLTKMEKSC